MLLNKKLYRRGDVVVMEGNRILVMLPGTAKEDALIAAGRLKNTFENHLSREMLDNMFVFNCRVVTFPDDGQTGRELLDRLGAADLASSEMSSKDIVD